LQALKTERKPPRLIVQITVDALRGDLPRRYAERFGSGGFRYLMEKGIYYDNARYQHANTETIVGHVALATGTVRAAQDEQSLEVFVSYALAERSVWDKGT
jgi:hypothetical protein